MSSTEELDHEETLASTALEQANLAVAVRAAKVAAGLDPELKYPPMRFVDHLPVEMRRLFWKIQIERVLNILDPDAEPDLECLSEEPCTASNACVSCRQGE